MEINRFENGQINIRGVEGDMGEDTKMDIIIERDGDVILTLRNPGLEEILRRAQAGVGQEISIQFCTKQGGGQNPKIATKLRELVMLLAEKT